MATNPTDLQTLLSMSDPLLSFKWMCSSLPLGHPVHYVEGIDLPFNNVSVGDKMHAAGGYSYFPGTHDISSFSMTFYEDSTASSSKFLLAWKNLVKNFETGFYGLPVEYKKDLTIVLRDVADNAVMTVELLGVWPSDTGNFSLNYTEAGRLTVTQTFSVDGQTITF